MRIISLSIVMLIILLFGGCASFYRSIKPDKFELYSKSENNCFTYSYKYDILKESNNRKLSKKAYNRNIKIVAVEITNLTDSTINLGRDVIVKSGEQTIYPMDPFVVRHQIHQGSPIYLLYLMMYAYYQECDGIDCNTQFYPIGVPIAIGNMIVAANANKKFLNELNYYNFKSTWLNPGEKKRALLCFNAINNNQLSFLLKDTLCSEMKESIEIQAASDHQKRYVNLADNLYYVYTDKNYGDYINRLDSLLELDSGINSHFLYEKRNERNQIVTRGFKAKHSYGVNENYSYKIGTWEFYDNEGMLIKRVNYDLREREINVIYNRSKESQ